MTTGTAGAGGEPISSPETSPREDLSGRKSKDADKDAVRRFSPHAAATPRGGSVTHRFGIPATELNP